MFAAISTMTALTIVLWLILAWIIGVQLYNWLVGRKVSKVVENEEFKAGLRKGQVVDIRESADFEAGHILGARSMPYSQFALYENALRKDKPVYLYDQNRSLCVRIAKRLYKKGFNEIYILKGGYAKWDGKTKKAKY
ncbi:rhodanese-like domain-containing protein [Ligilactobacillus equi]